MSHYLTAGWREDWLRKNPEGGEKTANQIQRRVRGVLDFLGKCYPGARLCFTGSCPSGATFWGFETWDGSDEVRDRIIENAVMSTDRLVDSAHHRRAISVAEMRT